jgi:hypothetical protein
VTTLTNDHDDLPRDPDPPARATDVDKRHPVTPPEDPQPRGMEVESARLLANEARDELGAAGYSDTRIDELADAFIADNVGQGIEEFVRWASLQGPIPDGETTL